MTESWHQNWRGLWLKWPQFLDGLFDLSETNFLTFGVEGSNCSSKMKSIDKTTWRPEEKEIMQKWSGVHTHLNGGDCEFHLTCNSCYSSCCSSPGCWWCLQPHRRSRTPGFQPRSTPDAPKPRICCYTCIFSDIRFIFDCPKRIIIPAIKGS